MDPRRRGQVIKALDQANEARLGRARLRDRIREKPSLAIDVILKPPDVMKNARVSYVLQSVNRVGEAWTKKWCRAAWVNPSTKVGKMTGDQRIRLVSELQKSRCFEEKA